MNETAIEGELSELALTLRVPKGTLDRIDALVKARPTKIPRHSWLLEAIYEKLYKEERMEGVLKIRRENSAEVGVPARYLLRFLRPDSQEGRPLVPMTVVGDDWLERYLVEWGLTAENAKGWIQNLKVVKSISIRDVLMPTDRVGRYGFKAPGWGIYLDLGGGKEAILSPDHPATLPDGTRGDRIRILTADGHAEKKAMVTPDGKVLIIHEEHIWPADAPPGTIKVGYSVASTEETREIMDAYKQYIPD